jgi:hypothetical protein
VQQAVAQPFPLGAGELAIQGVALRLVRCPLTLAGFCQTLVVGFRCAQTSGSGSAAGGASHRPGRCAADKRSAATLLRAAGDLWAYLLEYNGWRLRRQDRPAASYQELCRLLAASGPGTFGELDSTGARSALRRYSDSWCSAAARRKAGHGEVRYPRRRRALMPVRWYHGTFRLDRQRLRLPTAAGCPALVVRLDQAVPYPAEAVRSGPVRSGPVRDLAVRPGAALGRGHR